MLLFTAVGFAAEPIRLIVRGDDFGYSHASKLALEGAFEHGIVTSASLLTPGPWFAETARSSSANPSGASECI